MKGDGMQKILILAFLIPIIAHSMNNEFQQFYQLKVHKTPYACPYCAHARGVTSLEEYLEKYQQKQVALYTLLPAHVEQEHQDLNEVLWDKKKWTDGKVHTSCKCPQCNQLWKNLFLHYWSSHLSRNTNMVTHDVKNCPGCGKSFKAYAALRKHVWATVHVDNNGNPMTVNQFLETQQYTVVDQEEEWANKIFHHLANESTASNSVDGLQNTETADNALHFDLTDQTENFNFQILPKLTLDGFDDEFGKTDFKNIFDGSDDEQK